MNQIKLFKISQKLIKSLSSHVSDLTSALINLQFYIFVLDLDKVLRSIQILKFYLDKLGVINPLLYELESEIHIQKILSN